VAYSPEYNAKTRIRRDQCFICQLVVNTSRACILITINAEPVRLTLSKLADEPGRASERAAKGTPAKADFIAGFFGLAINRIEGSRQVAPA
jgi:hypothetical protein